MGNPLIHALGKTFFVFGVLLGLLGVLIIADGDTEEIDTAEGTIEVEDDDGVWSFIAGAALTFVGALLKGHGHHGHGHHHHRPEE